jgi:hypothetical protein
MASLTNVKESPKSPGVVKEKRKGPSRIPKSKSKSTGKTALGSRVPTESKNMEVLYRSAGSVFIKLATEKEPVKMNLFSGPTLQQYDWLKHANNGLCVAEYTSVKEVEQIEDKFFFEIKRNLEDLRLGLAAEPLRLISSLKQKIQQAIMLLSKELERLNEVLQEKN